MNVRRIALASAILIAIAAPFEAAAQTAAPAPVNAPAHSAKAKPKIKPKAAAPAVDIDAIKFSDPDAPPTGAAKPSKPSVASTGAAVSPVPEGGAALDLKWHADNSHINNPYWQPWVPNGQGANVEAGVKLGF
jgi:hypothetical protein